MKKLLHIIATPRLDESRTLQISRAFLDVFTGTHPGWVVEELNLIEEKLPELTLKRVDGKYVLLGGKDLFGDFKASWEEIIAHINRFLSADAYLLTTPMWNFNIPYRLKQYIDIIVQPKYLFRYTQDGVEGLAKNKKMAIAASRGGEYALATEGGLDYQLPYLRTIFNFVGITDIAFLVAQPMDMGIERQKKALEETKELARKLARDF